MELKKLELNEVIELLWPDNGSKVSSVEPDANKTSDHKEEFERLALKLWNVEMKIKHLEDEEKALKEKLKSHCNNETFRGREFIFERTDRKGAVNYSSIPEVKEIIKTVNIDEFRYKSNQIWKLKLKRPEDI